MWIYVHQHKVLLVLGLINIGCWPSASASLSPSSPTPPSSSEGGMATRKVYDINYRYIHRQLEPVPVPTTSSYNYWWPYPPQTLAAPPAVSTTTSTTPALLLSFDTPSTQSASPAMSSSTSNSSSSTSTSTSMASMITLTARPPQTTSPIPSIKSLPKNDPKTQFKVIYVLAPLFALLGVILGSVAAWLVYGCLTRKPRVRQTFGVEEKGIGGPRYMPAGDDDAGALGRDVDVENGRYPGLGLSPMMQEVDMETDEGMALFRWPGISGGRGKDVGVHGHGHGEGDPFLLPPSTQHNPKTRSSKSMRSVMSNATSLAFLELYESDEEALDDERREKRKKGREEDVPWESLRHKSIKRGILERVRKEAGWVDSLRGVVGSSFSQLAGDTNAADIGAKNGNAKKRHAHVRGNSDLRIEDLLSADGVSVPDKVRVRAESKRGDAENDRAGSPSKSATRPLLPTFDSTVTATTIATTKGTITASRANSSRTTYSTTSSDGNGFRILAESPLPHPPPLHSRISHTSQSTTSGDSSYWWWGEASEDIDRYTAVPARICRSRSQSRSRSTSPVKRSPLKGSEGGGRNVAQWPSARDVLPQSPPRIMSPMLEDQLCFTPKPGHGRSVDVATPTTPWGWGSVGVGEVPTPTPMPRSGGAGKDGKGMEKEKGRRLRSPRPPSLPFPRDPDRGLLNSPRPAEDVFRGRLVKQQSSSPSRKPTGLSRDKTLPGRPVSDGGGDGVDVSGALTKVGEIVKQSWSTRELQLGEAGMRSLSPTGFGRRA